MKRSSFFLKFYKLLLFEQIRLFRKKFVRQDVNIFENIRVEFFRKFLSDFQTNIFLSVIGNFFLFTL